ncbi:MAG: helix-turn-helix transcriptional regulator [Candidatus Caldarchaeum sp.]|nr:helix-turn-helix transcriptional regulator [Candidatus Caldarchaeum sp.]MCS7137741.1 helix-turn-helix transcriptional regulator [Candidatus Caldarchaeum sp.]MDW7977455.1 helix-turn-helix domain-containing protein [Candidatus Caldarchaeum sp.]MDW8359045.1 helix-turn-helix domain-containing protein [Candidatus Caldarchaeum sp.]
MTEPRHEGKVCPMVAAAKLLGSMWSLVLISYLHTGPKGFNELLKLVPELNSKTLSRTLKALQARGLVERRVLSIQPFSVSYSLTPMAEELAPLLEGLRRWGAKWMAVNSCSFKASRSHAPKKRAIA